MTILRKLFLCIIPQGIQIQLSLTQYRSYRNRHLWPNLEAWKFSSELGLSKHQGGSSIFIRIDISHTILFLIYYIELIVIDINTKFLKSFIKLLKMILSLKQSCTSTLLFCYRSSKGCKWNILKAISALQYLTNTWHDISLQWINLPSIRDPYLRIIGNG